MTVTCFIPGPTEVIAERDAGARWCFGCRARLPHTDYCLSDALPSYYEPIWVRRCSRCGKDRTDFPGLCRKAQVDYQRRSELRGTPGTPGRTHGCISTYNAGCDCRQCMDAGRAARARSRAARRVS